MAIVLRLHGGALMAAAVLTALAYPFLKVPLSAAWGLLRRARVLLASLLIVHAWLTPGEPLWAPLGPLSPSVEGLRDAAWRATTLVTVIALIALLIARTTPSGLAAGLAVLARPTGRLAHSLALRLAMTLDLAARPLPVLALAPGDGGRLARFADRLGGYYAAALAGAPGVPLPEMPPVAGRLTWVDRAVMVAAVCAAVVV